MRDRGGRIPTKGLANWESVLNGLVIYWGLHEQTGRSFRIAASDGENQASPDLLSRLMNVEIAGAAPLPFTVAEFERIRRRRRAVDVARKWRVRAP